MRKLNEEVVLKALDCWYRFSETLYDGDTLEKMLQKAGIDENKHTGEIEAAYEQWYAAQFHRHPDYTMAD